MYIQSRYNQQLISNRDFQQKINFQAVEIETLKRQMESVQTVDLILNSIHCLFLLFSQANLTKDTEILETREKAKTDYEKKLRIIQKDIEMNEELKDRIKQLENDLKGTEKKL